MNRFKLIVLSSVLSLITIGVFAGRTTFAESLNLYVNNGAMVQITSGSQTFTQLTTTPSGSNIQAQIKNRNGQLRDLYHFDGTDYVPVYSTSSW